MNILFNKINDAPINDLTKHLTFSFCVTIFVSIALGILLTKLSLPSFIVRIIVSITSLFLMVYTSTHYSEFNGKF